MLISVAVEPGMPDSPDTKLTVVFHLRKRKWRIGTFIIQGEVLRVNLLNMG